jgi:fructokinase
MKHRILSIGEVLWDLLPSGPLLGGAPANFAVHAQALGGEVRLLSRVGKDALGQEIALRLQARGMSTNLLGIDDALPTGTVSVTLAGDGQPHYIIHEHVAWDAIAATPAAEMAAREAAAVCFGSLAQRSPTSCSAVQGLVAASSREALRVFDINLRQAFYSRAVIETSLGLATVLKLNDTELPVLAEMLGLGGDTRSQLAALARQFDLRAIAFTRGADGSCLLVGHEWSDHPGVPTTVADTIGAGDSFTAAFVLGLLDLWPVPALHQRASEVAAFVCSQPGPTPPLPDSFRLHAS